jgi:putative two-component system response regulator
MHDVGKIGIPDAILLKEGPLNEIEWEMMKRHPMIGARLLEGSKSPLLEMARQIALTHHERWDGSGYPAGLVGEDIPIAGRIVMLADHYDALRSDRPYKESMSHFQACDVFFSGDDRARPEHFDPKLLTAFRAVQDQFDGIFRVFGD